MTTASAASSAFGCSAISAGIASRTRFRLTVFQALNTVSTKSARSRRARATSSTVWSWVPNGLLTGSKAASLPRSAALAITSMPAGMG